MLAVVVTTFASFDRLSPGESDALDGISRAFFAALDRDSSDFVLGVLGTLALGAAYVVAGWLRRDAESAQRERRDLEARRERIASEAPPRLERREWVRIPANVAMKVMQPGETPRARPLALGTHDVGAGGLSFFSAEPPQPGSRLRLALDLDGRTPVAVRAVVVRVSSPPGPGAPSLVGVRFAEIDSTTRETLVKWIVAKERRGIAQARRGRLCACCERPLADGAEEMHPTCAARMHGKQAA